jgi:hypothetical protein
MRTAFYNCVMAGLDPAILFGGNKKDARLKAGHDGSEEELCALAEDFDAR